MTRTNDDDPARAFAALYEAHFGRVRSWLLQRTKSPETAEDITQNVFLRAWRYWPTFVDHGGGYQPWLYRIVRNELVTWHRRQRDASSLEQPVVGTGETLGDRIAAAAEDADAIATRLDAVATIQRAGAGKLRESVAIAQGYSYEEIADALGVTNNYVRVRVHRQRQRLAAAG